MKKKLFLSILILTLFIFCFASANENAPEASSFQNVGMGAEPDSLGDVGLTMPILSVSGRKMSFPLVLNYGAGIRLDDEASWVGLGWNLGAGSIRRIVNNIPDSYDASDTCANGKDGFLVDPEGDDYKDQDKYIVSSPGGSGQLFKGDDGEWHLTNWRPWKIQAFGEPEITKWIITTEDGSKYVFEKTVMTKNTNYEVKSIRLDENYAVVEEDVQEQDVEKCYYTYAWYLTEVLSPDYVDPNSNGPDDNDPGDWVKINYETNSFYTYTTPKTAVYETIFPGSSGTGHETWGWRLASWGESYTGFTFSYVRYTSEVEKTFVQEIISPVSKANFVTSDTRIDSKDDSGNSPPRLDKIELINRIDDNVVNTVNFNYDFSLAKGSCDDPLNGKLTLLDVEQEGKLEGKLPPTSFEYANNPDYHYFARDFWGYYNGFTSTNNGYNLDYWGNLPSECKSAGNQFSCMKYKLYHEDDNRQGSDDAKAWSLTKVNFPTGGSIEYDYEADRYKYVSEYYSDRPEIYLENLLDYRPVDWQPERYTGFDPITITNDVFGGGIRLKQKIIRDGLGEESPHKIIVGYEYGDGASVTHLDLFNELFINWKKFGSQVNYYVSYPYISIKIPEDGSYGETIKYYTSVIDFPNLRSYDAPIGYPHRCRYFIKQDYRRNLVDKVEVKDSMNQIKSLSRNYYLFSSKYSFTDDKKDPTFNFMFFDPSYNYNIDSWWVKVDKTDSMVDGVTNTVNYQYNSENGQVFKTTQTNSDRREISSETHYTFENPAYLDMKNKNILTAVETNSVYEIFPGSHPDVLRAYSKTIYSDNFPGNLGQWYVSSSKTWFDRNENNIVDSGELIGDEIIDYNQYGAPLQTYDSDNDHTTYLYYGDNDDPCDDTGTEVDFKNAFLTCVDDSISGEDSMRVKTFYNDDGSINKIQDENGQEVHFRYDEFNRLTKSWQEPDDENDPSVSYEYMYAYDNIGCPNGPGIDGDCPNYVETNQKIEDGKISKAQAWWDGLGRTWQNQVKYSDESKTLANENFYNEIGKIYLSTQPFLVDAPLGEIENVPASDDLGTKILFYGTFGILGGEEKQMYEDFVPYDQVHLSQESNGAYKSKVEYYKDPLARVEKTWPIEDEQEVYTSSEYGSETIDGHYYLGDGIETRTVTVYDECSTSCPTGMEGCASSYFSDWCGKNQKGVTSYSDKFGNVIRVKDRDDNTADSQYDILGNLLEVKIADGEQIQTTEYTYDNLGRQKSVNHVDFGTVTSEYDDNGNVIETRDANGNVVNYQYDELNRLRVVEYPDYNVEYFYDGNDGDDNNCLRDNAYSKGKLCKIRDKSGWTKYGYDHKGRIEIVIRKTLQEVFVTEYTYDNANNLKTMTAPNGKVTEYFYNVMGQLESVNVEGDEVIAYNYNPTGTLNFAIYGNDARTDYEYTPRNWVNNMDTCSSSESDCGGSADIFSRIYNYDYAGNIWLETEQMSGSEVNLAKYEYDDLYQLTNVIDNPGNILGWGSREYYNTNINYEYDKFGNRINLQMSGPSQHLPSGSYTYNEFDDRDQLTNRLKIDPEGCDYSYDNNGNVISKNCDGEETTFLYDANNQITRVVLPSGKVEWYWYDFSGKRVAKLDVSGNMIYYMWQGNDVTYEKEVGLYPQYNLNCDGEVGLADFGLFANNYGKTGEPGDVSWCADFDKSGVVDLADFGLFANNYGKTGDCDYCCAYNEYSCSESSELVEIKEVDLPESFRSLVKANDIDQEGITINYFPDDEFKDGKGQTINTI